MRIGHTLRRRGLIAATATLTVAAGVAVASVAGAAQSVTVYATENTVDARKPCFSVVPSKPTCATDEVAEVTIQTGDTVTWDFNGSAPGSLGHNAVSTNTVAADPDWEEWKIDFQNSGTVSREFYAPGVYEFLCQAHAGMEGTITVEGEPVDPPPDEEEEEEEEDETPQVVASVSPTPTATAAAASTDDHTTTPAPGHGSAKDTEKPRLASASVKSTKGGVQLRFWLSEPATVSISARRKGSRAVVASATVQAPAGTRSFVLRSKRFTKGTYTLVLASADAMGNLGAPASKTLKVK